MDLKQNVRTIADYPKTGIMFRDVTTLFADPDAFLQAIDEISAPFADEKVDLVVGGEARGFILGGAVATRLRAGFVPVRKPGKLPGATLSEAYSLEYGVDELHLHEGAITENARVLLVDDLIATGGTASAAARLVRRAGGLLLGAAFLIDLPDLGGAAALSASGLPVHAVMSFEGH